MEGDEARCLEAGANDYLSKPVSLKELRVAVEAQLALPTRLRVGSNDPIVPAGRLGGD
jgi:DNA-binding response OmpR family regulator